VPASALQRQNPCAIIDTPSRLAMKFIDVSVPLDANLPTYPGNTAYRLEPIKRIRDGGTSNLSTIHCSAHCGTHVDAPRHFLDRGSGVETLPLDLWSGWTICPSRATKPRGRRRITRCSAPVSS